MKSKNVNHGLSLVMGAGLLLGGCAGNIDGTAEGETESALTTATGGLIEVRCAEFDGKTHLSGWGEFYRDAAPAGSEPYYFNEMENVPLDTCIPWGTAVLPDDATGWQDIDIGASATVTSSRDSLVLNQNGGWYGYVSNEVDTAQSSNEEIFNVQLAGSASVPAQSFAGGLRLPPRPHVTTLSNRDDYILAVGQPFTIEWVPGGYDAPSTVPGEFNMLTVALLANNTGVLCRVVDDGSFTFPGSAISTLPRKGTVSVTATSSRFVTVDGRTARFTGENQFMNNYTRYKK
jgi:hypothetical protein